MTSPDGMGNIGAARWPSSSSSSSSVCLWPSWSRLRRRLDLPLRENGKRVGREAQRLGPRQVIVATGSAALDFMRRCWGSLLTLRGRSDPHTLAWTSSRWEQVTVGPHGPPEISKIKRPQGCPSHANATDGRSAKRLVLRVEGSTQ